MDPQQLEPPENPVDTGLNQARAGLVTSVERELAERLANNNDGRHVRFILAALSGIPWVGLLSAIANFNAEGDQDEINTFLNLWMLEHKGKIEELRTTITDILNRLDGFGDEVRRRIESPEYIALVRRTFRSWDQADTQEKRFMLKHLLTNAGAITLCPDDQVRLFIGWIDRFHESHFAVMKQIYQHQPITKGRIWDNLHPEGRPRDNSAEAGLFSYLMRELNLGGIIHLERPTNSQGQTLRSTRTSSSSNRGDVLESPFDTTKVWVLSELGKEFVRYVMEDVDPQLNEARSV